MLLLLCVLLLSTASAERNCFTSESDGETKRCWEGEETVRELDGPAGSKPLVIDIHGLTGTGKGLMR